MDKHRKARTESAWPTWPWPIGKRKRSLNKNMKSSPSHSGLRIISSFQLPTGISASPPSLFAALWQANIERSEVIHLAFRDSSHQEPRGLQQFATKTPWISSITNHMLQDEILYCYHCVLSRRCSQCSLHLWLYRSPSPWVKVFEHVGTL